MNKIICHGDSLTEGADIEITYRWPSLLSNALGTEVINTGIGGDTTGGQLSRFPMDVAARKPMAVIIMGGTNDFWWDLPVNAVMANLYAMAYQAQHAGIAPIFGLPLTFDREAAEKQPCQPPEAGYEGLQAKLTSLVSRLRTSATESEIPVLDFYGLFTEESGEVLTRYFLDDGLHANREGHKRMAEMTAARLREWFLF